MTSEGAVIREWGEEIGIEFDIPPGAVPQGKKLDLSVWPCSAGPFQLPDDYVLASPVFLVSPNFEFSIDITVTVHHFYVLDTREDCDDMAFLSSPATPGDHQKPVYQLKVLSKGTFEPTEECGRVALRHFCLLTAGKRKRKSREEANSSKRAKGNLKLSTLYHNHCMLIFVQKRSAMFTWYTKRRTLDTLLYSQLFQRFHRTLRLAICALLFLCFII